MTKKYYQFIYGCQMNVADAEVLGGMLQDASYEPTGVLEEADLIVMTTCAVRERAEERVFGQVGQLYRLKQTNPNLIIAIGGCIPQQPQVAAEIRRRFPYVDIIFGTHNLGQFADYLRSAESGKQVMEIWEHGSEVAEGLRKTRDNGLRAFVPIMYGCNNFCTYCIVPYVRGRERSRPMDGILKELRDLAARGYKEVTLLGQNVNSYGHDLPEQGIDFSDLLAAADETGVARVRFLTSHPKDLSPKLVTTIANGKHLCEQIHLPVQAGSDRTLKRMGRRYTVEQYLEKVNMIRSQMPEVAITTDLIVGFPGETEAEYEETLQLVSRVRFGAAFTFAYSVRPGTPAARMPEQVPEPEKLRRLQGLIDLQNSVSKEESARLVGKIEEVLVEGQSERDPAMLAGRTRTNRMVHFAGPADLTGTFRHVRITSSHTFTLMGELIPQKEGQA